MPRRQPKPITFTIDGREVTAPEGQMLVDAAKGGDVEIPVFCYEPKLGQPVGACRMCLVEIEGIPKLQTGCSTAVKDGMVVHTQNDRVREAQQAVVEFLLVNHPLDCPVCDKGGECPLQDITFGWGAGTSRFIEPKRHFRKPVHLSPLIAIDRERCILCYRCVRYSQEVAEDYQLVLHERGAHSYVGTFDGHPYVAPFSGNVIELCPVGALTSNAYRFRARPWEIENAGSLCTLCPSQCNVHYTVRDEKAMRVLARDHSEVDDGWLCDKGRFAYQATHVDERLTTPMARDGGALRPVSWERALGEAAAALAKAGPAAAAIAGGGATNEEGFLLQRLFREALGSASVGVQGTAALPPQLRRALAAPQLQASVPDLEYAHAVLVLDCEPMDDAPILELRIRKGVRHHGMRLAVATSRPSALDASASAIQRFLPGAGELYLTELLEAARGGGANPVIDALKAAGEEMVIVYGERLLRSENAAKLLLELATALRLGAVDGAGLLEIPTAANGRGLREAGMLPGAGPGYAEAPAPDPDAAAPTALYLLGPDVPPWAPATVIAHASVVTEALRERATVVFPAEAPPEKEGTVVHPDGRVQRLRQAIARVGDVRPEWQVVAELASRCGTDLGVLTNSMAFKQLVAAVPFYAGLTLEELAGRGVRWPATEAAARLPVGAQGPFELREPGPPAGGPGLRVGTWRSLWASPEVAISPSLKFLVPREELEISPVDAQRLGVREDEEVVVAYNGTSVRARTALRQAVPAGSVFVQGDALPDGSVVEVRPG